MISVVMPYWRRKEALEKTLSQYKKLYSDFKSLEIIIVDDGSPEPATIEGQWPWPISVIRLPKKGGALNPCIPFNVGATAAYGDILCITNPEVIHQVPILRDMADELERLGPTGYVAASCWDEASKVWYCHTHLCPPEQKMGRARIPEGAGFHFFAMFYLSFFESIEGFCEAYRDGQGFEDNDFLWKLHKAGAKFKIRDDLVTHHQQCPRTQWPKGGHDRNMKLFESRWECLT
jgi:glycosyltransferase involved in cell wall biosynthesis